MITDAETWKLALLLLEPDEVDECIKRAFHRLDLPAQDTIETVAALAMDHIALQSPPDILRLIARVGTA